MANRINHLAVWVAAIVYFLFGYLWYTVFSAQWMALTNRVAADVKPSVPLYLGSFFLGLILAYATALALARRPEDRTVRQGVSFALFMGIALYATQTLNQTLYEARPVGLWLIDAGYVIIGFAIMGAIVGGWKGRAGSK